MSRNMKGFLTNQTKNTIKIWISTENEKNVLTVLTTFALLLERGRCFRKSKALKMITRYTYGRLNKLFIVKFLLIKNNATSSKVST